MSDSFPLHIVLHEPEIPQNAGNIGRTCTALGAKLWMVRPLGFSLDTKHLRRAGLDYWKHLQWEAVDNWEQLTQRLPDRRYWYFSKTASNTYTQVEYALGDVLVFGRESQGLPPELLGLHPEQALRVPMGPLVRSLNLATTAAIVSYEAYRQLGDQWPGEIV